MQFLKKLLSVLIFKIKLISFTKVFLLNIVNEELNRVKYTIRIYLIKSNII